MYIGMAALYGQQNVTASVAELFSTDHVTDMTILLLVEPSQRSLQAL